MISNVSLKALSPWTCPGERLQGKDGCLGNGRNDRLWERLGLDGLFSNGHFFSNVTKYRRSRQQLEILDYGECKVAWFWYVFIVKRPRLVWLPKVKVELAIRSNGVELACSAWRCHWGLKTPRVDFLLHRLIRIYTVTFNSSNRTNWRQSIEFPNVCSGFPTRWWIESLRRRPRSFLLSWVSVQNPEAEIFMQDDWKKQLPFWPMRLSPGSQEWTEGEVWHWRCMASSELVSQGLMPAFSAETDIQILRYTDTDGDRPRWRLLALGGWGREKMWGVIGCRWSRWLHLKSVQDKFPAGRPSWDKFASKRCYCMDCNICNDIDLNTWQSHAKPFILSCRILKNFIVSNSL